MLYIYWYKYIILMYKQRLVAITIFWNQDRLHNLC